MRNSTVPSPWRYRVNSPLPSSSSQGNRSHKNRTRELDRKQEPPRRYKRPLPERDARVAASTDRQDPLRSSPNKRSRSCALDEDATRSHKRVPLVEIRKEPWSETAYAFGTKDSSTKNDNRRRRQRARDSPVKCSDILREDRRSNVHAYSAKRYRRTKSDSGTWDRVQSTRESMKHSAETSSKPLDQPENCRDSSKHWGRYEESWKGTRSGEVVDLRGEKRAFVESSSEVRREGCEKKRVGAWKLACALAHEYLKKKYAEEESDEGCCWAVKGFVQQQVCAEDDDLDTRMGGVCMDGVVNPTQAAAFNGDFTSVETC